MLNAVVFETLKFILKSLSFVHKSLLNYWNVGLRFDFLHDLRKLHSWINLDIERRFRLVGVDVYLDPRISAFRVHMVAGRLKV